MSKFLALIPTSLLLLAGCGGSGTSTHQPPPPPPPPPPGQVIATPGPPNAESLVIDSGPNALTTPATNTAFVTVKVCMPDGTFATCQTIDHIEIDTGSIGLRIIAAGNPAGQLSLALPAVADPNNANHVLAECLEFADGFSWGSVNRADISLPVSGETATNVIVHVIGATSAGDPANANPTCVPPAPLVTENTVPAFGANGILGVGPFVNDCNSTSACTAQAPTPAGCSGMSCYPGNSATYFSCTTPPAALSCAQTNVPLDHQLPNPAVVFAKHPDGSVDNNGVIVELPAVGASGAAGPFTGGVLVFGIGTQTNNAITGATKLPADQSSGVISATLNGKMYPNSYLDSGSNANLFPSTLPGCPSPNQGFLCPGSTTNESATLQGTNGTVLTADFSVANANSLFSNANYVAFPNLAGNNSDNTSVDLGLSFFYGRNIFTGFENPNVSAPYFAY